VTFDEALTDAMKGGGKLKRGGSPVVWIKAGWTPDSPEVYGRVQLASGLLCRAPVTLTTEDLTATDWELVPSAP
jgi:hypothetical protein